MSRKIARLRYEFEFDPYELWSSKSEFDNALAKFFKFHGIEANAVTFIGAVTDCVFVLKKMEKIEQPKPKIMSRPVKRKGK